MTISLLYYPSGTSQSWLKSHKSSLVPLGTACFRLVVPDLALFFLDMTKGETMMLILMCKVAITGSGGMICVISLPHVASPFTADRQRLFPQLWQRPPPYGHLTPQALAAEQSREGQAGQAAGGFPEGPGPAAGISLLTALPPSTLLLLPAFYLSHPCRFLCPTPKPSVAPWCYPFTSDCRRTMFCTSGRSSHMLAVCWHNEGARVH